MGGRRVVVVTAVLAAIAVPTVAASARPDVAQSPRGHAAKLTLSRTSGLPGQKVTFHGTHFRAHEKVVLHWGSAHGAKLGHAKAGKSGAVTGHFAIPDPTAKVARKTAVVAVGAKDHKKVRATFTQTCTDAWSAKGSGNWATAKDWSKGVVPGASDVTCITRNRSKSYTVALGGQTGSTTVGTLILGSPSGTHTQSLEILPSGGDLHLDLAVGGVIEKRGELALGVTPAGGNVFLDGATLANFGTLTTVGLGYSRYFTDPVVNEKGATLRDANACTNCTMYFGNPASLANDGTMAVSSGAFVVTTNATISEAAGTIANQGSFILNGGTLALTAGTLSGNPLLLDNGVTLNDHATAGTVAFRDTGTLNGNVPAGQTLVVDGDGGSDVKLAVPAAFTNNGTIDLTSDTQYSGQTNSWLVPQSATPTTLTNNALVETTGSGYSRYFDINITNAAGGRLDFASTSGDNYLSQAQGAGSTTITNTGSMTVGDGTDLRLAGTVYGQADFVQSAGGTLNMTNDVTHDTTSLIHQFPCSGSGCQNESVLLGGTINVTTIGSAASYVPIYSEAYALTGSFGSITGTPAYTASYNSPDAALSNPPGDVILTPAP